MKVSLLLFTINEIEGMKAIMPQIRKEWYDQLLIADGGSTDGTLEYAQEQGYPIFVQSEAGAGAAFLQAMERLSGEIIIVFSPDGNSLPEKIPELVAKMKQGYDIVICSRYLAGAKSYDDDRVTAFGNWLFTRLTNLLFGSKITDSLVMYRAYKRNIIGELKIDHKGTSWGGQILFRALKKKMKLGEIPGDEPARIGGVRKMLPLRNGLVELKMMLREFLICKY